MKPFSLTLALTLVLSVDAIRAGDGKPTTPSWPAAPEWRTETIPFPLDFAPGIKREGIEEIRFAPGFGKPSEGSYFTYAFLWVLTSGQEIGAEDLRKELKLYFDGLMRAVAAGAKLDLTVDSKVDVDPVPAGAGGFPGSPTFRVSVATVDAFYTKKPVHLKMSVYADACPGASGRTVYFEVSPRLSEEDVKKALSDTRARLSCPPKEARATK